MSNQELSQSLHLHEHNPFADLTDEQIVAVVQTYLALEGAWKRKPADLKGQSFYGSFDFWFYVAISDDKTCWTCEILNGSTLAGIDLRLLFPYHMIIDSDQILPMVHPNCRCTMLRVTDIQDYLDITTAPEDVYLGTPTEAPPAEKPPATPFKDTGGYWVTVDGRRIFVPDKTVGPPETENRPLTHNDELGNWEGRYRGIRIYMEDNVKDPQGTYAAYCKEIDSLTPAQGAGVNVIWLHEDPGRNFSAGGKKFQTGAEYSSDFHRVDAFGGEFKDDTHFVLGHESGHAVYDEAATRSQSSGVVEFRDATDKEGGVSDYARAWMNESQKGGDRSGHEWDIGYNENFAEMTRWATFAADDPARINAIRTKYPETYAAWETVMLRMNVIAQTRGFSAYGRT